jgi:hypothetical protein
MAFRDQDVPTVLADFGDAVVIDGTPGVGILDENDEVLVQDQQRGEVIVPVSTLIVQTSAFPNLKIDTALTVNGKNYTIRQPLKTGDAALTKLLLGTT